MTDSVLNTDAFDRRRFKELLDMSAKLKAVEEQGREQFPSFSPLMGDIWACFFKMKPELVSEVPLEREMNRQLMEQIMQEEGFTGFREFTRLDDLSSALGTMKYSETVLEWIKEQTGKNDELAEALRQAANGEEGGDQLAAEAMADALAKNGRSLYQSLQQAAGEAVQTKENMKSLLGGITAGSGEGELQKTPLRDQLMLAEKMSTLPKLKDIAAWAGRFKLIAQQKQRSKYKEAIARSGVRQGNQIEHLLPVELAAYASPLTKLDFMRRYVEGQTLQYDAKDKEQLGKGPIILCLDQSGSMQNQDTISKGFVLALMSIARKQRRDFALILFSGSAKKARLYERGKITVQAMVELTTTFLGGGTDFEPPLREALEVLQKSRFKQADVVFVTDGDGHISAPFIQRWRETKEQKGFKVLSLLLGSARQHGVEPFSDRTVLAKSFYDEKAVTQAFEI